MVIMIQAPKMAIFGPMQIAPGNMLLMLCSHYKSTIGHTSLWSNPWQDTFELVLTVRKTGRTVADYSMSSKQFALDFQYT